MDDPMPSLRAFASSLQDMDGALEQAFLSHKTLDAYLGTLNDQELEPLQKAQSVTMLAYLIYDCIWMWLRTKGIEPSTHPILKELDRIKGFFAKIQAAEKTKAGSGQPMKLDKDAAGRLLRQPMKDAQTGRASSATSKTPMNDVGTTTRFNTAAKAVAYHDQASQRAQEKMAARQADDDNEQDGEDNENDSSDSDLQVFGELVPAASRSSPQQLHSSGSASPAAQGPESNNRPKPASDTTTPGVSVLDRSQKKKKRKRQQSKSTSDASSATSSAPAASLSAPSTSGAQPAQKKPRRRKAKNKVKEES